MGQRGRKPGSGSALKLDVQAELQLKYLRIALGQPASQIVGAMIGDRFALEDERLKGKLSNAVKAELRAAEERMRLEAELTRPE